MTNDERDKMANETHAAVMRMDGLIAEHHKSLYGNGRIGLCDRVQILETSGKIAISICAFIGTLFGAGTGFVLQKFFG